MTPAEIFAEGLLTPDQASAIVRAMRSVESVSVAMKAGDWVTWPTSGGKATGRVVSVHTSSTVPNAMTKVKGTESDPAARVRPYAKGDDGKWRPGDTLVAHKLSELSSCEAPMTEAVAGSWDDMRSKVQDAIGDRIESMSGTDPGWVCVEDIGDGWAVYSLADGDMTRVEWSADPSGGIVLGDPVDVSKVTTYVPEAPAEGMAEAVEDGDRIEGRLLDAKGANATGGRVFGVRIIAYGDSKNNRRYPEAVMREAAPLYEGAKAYNGHRTQAELASSTVAGLVGHYRNVSAGPSGIDAELHLLPSAAQVAEALDASLAAVAQGLPPLAGISHDVMALYRPSAAGGRTIQEATRITRVNSADVVADPAAGGLATRMVAGGSVDQPMPKEGTMNLKQLLELLRAADASKRAELLKEHSAVLETAGYSAEEATILAGPEPKPEPEKVPAMAGAAATEAVRTFSRSTGLGSMLFNAALAEKNIAHLSEAVAKQLGDSWTEDDLSRTVESAVGMIEIWERENLTPRVPTAQVTQEALDKKIAAVDAMLDPSNTGGYPSLRSAFADIDGRRDDPLSAQFNRRLMQECRGSEATVDPELRSTESVTTSTFSYIFGDSITRRMVAEYGLASLQTWRPIVSSFFNLTDFRTQRLDRLGGYGVLPAVNEGAPYQPLTTPGNEEATYSASKRGGTEDLTWETIRNDDLRAVQRIPVKLGRAASQTLFRFVWDFLNANPTLTYDSVALFASGHSNNNVTSNALSQTALDLARIAMRKQSAYGDTSEILSVIPKYLVVPPDLEALAFQLSSSAVAIPGGTTPSVGATDVPNIHQGLQPIVVDYFSATSANRWFLVADPNMCPTIELGFLDGKQTPDLFVQNDETHGAPFNADKIVYKIRHVYGGAATDHRGFYRGGTA